MDFEVTIRVFTMDLTENDLLSTDLKEVRECVMWISERSLAEDLR